MQLKLEGHMLLRRYPFSTFINAKNSSRVDDDILKDTNQFLLRSLDLIEDEKYISRT